MNREKLPVLPAQKLIKVFESLGFEEKQLKATSHRRFIHSDGRKTIVPFHKGKDIGKGLLRKILRDIEISPDEFNKLLK